MKKADGSNRNGCRDTFITSYSKLSNFLEEKGNESKGETNKHYSGMARDVALHPKTYPVDETPGRFSSDVEHHPHREITSNDNGINKTTFCNYGHEFEILPLSAASHLSVQKQSAQRHLEIDSGQRSRKPIQAWMEAVETMAEDRKNKIEKNN